MSSRLLDRRRVDGVELLHGEVTSPAYDAVHRRAVLFVAGEYWLVVDTVRADGPHDYAVRWHLADPAPPRLSEPTGDLSRVTTPTVLLDVAGHTRVGVEPGWVSAEYGVRTSAPVVVASVDRRTDAHLVTLLAPRRDGASHRLREVDLTSGTVVVEHVDGGEDRLSWSGSTLRAQLARRGGRS